MAKNGTFTYYPVQDRDFGLRVVWTASYSYSSNTHYVSVNTKLYLDYENGINTSSFFYTLGLTDEQTILNNYTGFSDNETGSKLLTSLTHKYTMSLKSGSTNTYEAPSINVSASAGSSGSGTAIYYEGYLYYLTIDSSAIVIDDWYDPGSTVTASISNITTNSALLTLSSSYSVERTNWWYSINSQLNLYGSTYATSVEIPLTNLTQNTEYSVYGGGIDEYGRSSSSNTVTFTTAQSAPPSITLTIQNVTATTATIAAVSNEECASWRYWLDGTSYDFTNSSSGTSATQQITGLTSGSSHNIYVTAVSASTTILGTSSTIAFTTNARTVSTSTSYSMSLTASPILEINVIVADNSNRHDISFRYNNNGSTSTKLIASKIALNSGNNSISISSENEEWLERILGTSTTYTFDLVIVTYDSSSSWLGFDESSDVVVTVPSSDGPVFSNFTYADISTSATSVSGSNQILVSGYSEIHIDASSAAPSTGEIVSYTATYGSGDLIARSEVSGFNLGTINISGTHPLTVTVTDSYGRSTSVTRQVTTLPYSKISQGALTITTEVQNEERVIKASVSGQFYNVGNNDISAFYYQYRRSDETSWSTAEDVTVTKSGQNYSITDYIIDADLSEDYSWYIRFTVSDLLSTDSSETILATSVPLMSFRKGMVGINNKNPNSALDVIGIIEQNGFGVEGFVRTIDSVSENLNDILTTGIYVAQWSSGDISTNNYPTSATGILEVLPDTDAVMQRFTIVPADGRVWLRSGDSTSFGSWHQISGSGSFTQEQVDWNVTDQTSVSYIKNKPTLRYVSVERYEGTTDYTIVLEDT